MAAAACGERDRADAHRGKRAGRLNQRMHVIQTSIGGFSMYNSYCCEQNERWIKGARSGAFDLTRFWLRVTVTADAKHACAD
jgi:hypothetical protein